MCVFWATLPHMWIPVITTIKTEHCSISTKIFVFLSLYVHTQPSFPPISNFWHICLLFLYFCHLRMFCKWNNQWRAFEIEFVFFFFFIQHSVLEILQNCCMYQDVGNSLAVQWLRLQDMLLGALQRNRAKSINTYRMCRKTFMMRNWLTWLWRLRSPTICPL